VSTRRRTARPKRARSKAVRAKKKAPASGGHPVRRLGASDQRLVERVRKLCMKLPEANEKISHGEPTWFAGKGKVFAMIDGHHHNSPHLSVWLPQPFGAQEALIDADPERFFRPPYVGVSGWVGVVLDTKPDWGVVEGLIRESYLHVATAKLSKVLLGD
jgi:predicted DNA-binding protein (MmcQ/YjbR family)